MNEQELEQVDFEAELRAAWELKEDFEEYRRWQQMVDGLVERQEYPLPAVLRELEEDIRLFAPHCW